MIAVITIFQVERNGFGDKIVKTSAKNAVFFKKNVIFTCSLART
jgi:hypothetical protein